MKPLSLCSLLLLFSFPLLSQGYYPLQIGNVWQYRDSYDSTYGWTQKAVKDTTMPTGSTYTVIINDALVEGYVRQEGTMVYHIVRYPTSDTTYQYHEKLYYDFSKTTGDTVSVTVQEDPSDTITIRVIDDKMVNVFGTMRRTWVFYETSKRTSGYALWQIADSIGMIYTAGEGGTAFSLAGAIINGINYGTVTRVDGSSPSDPNTYLICQNHPNPFNSSTTIEFNIPNERHVAVSVYNILGEQIRHLFEGHLPIGLHQLVWDGKDDFGVAVGTGVYLYQLKTDGFVGTRKMMLLR